MATKTKKASSASRASGAKAKKPAGKAGKSAGAKTRAKAKAAKPAASTKAKAAGAKKGAGGRGKTNAAFMKPMEIKEPLQPIVGDKPIPRTEVVKRVWAYIREHRLQDQQNKRQIHADENLKKVFGGKDNVSMFEMTKLINQNLGG